MTGYVLSAFTEQHESWVERRKPTPDWNIAVLDWVVALDANVWDEAIKFHWGGNNAWLAVIRLPWDRDQVVKCEYHVYNGPKAALCTSLDFAPFYDT